MVTYKKLIEWLGNFKEQHPELEICLQAYNGYYHLSIDGERVCVSKYPSGLWEMFCVWKNGYYKGMEVNNG